jgi:hypothetical protein
LVSGGTLVAQNSLLEHEIALDQDGKNTFKISASKAKFPILQTIPPGYPPFSD